MRVLNALARYWAAAWLDVSIAGSIAVATGLFFFGIFVLSPSRGLLSAVRRRARQKMEYRERIVLIHLRHHEGSGDEAEELGVGSIHRHLGWPRSSPAPCCGASRPRGKSASRTGW